MFVVVVLFPFILAIREASIFSSRQEQRRLNRNCVDCGVSDSSLKASKNPHSLTFEHRLCQSKFEIEWMSTNKIMQKMYGIKRTLQK